MTRLAYEGPPSLTWFHSVRQSQVVAPVKARLSETIIKEEGKYG